MKKIIIIPIALISLIISISCGDKYYKGIYYPAYNIYISADSINPSNKVEISYPEKASNPPDIHYVTETVSLPFYKQVKLVGFTCCSDTGNPPFYYLTVYNHNYSTINAIVFDDSLKLKDGICKVTQMFDTTKAIGSCIYCKTLPMKSVMMDLKSSKYSCYIEFTSRDYSKMISNDDWIKR